MDNEIKMFFQQMIQRFDQIDERFDRVDQRLDKLDQRLDKLEQRIDKLEQRMDKLEQRMDKLEHRMDIMEVKQDRTKEQLGELQLSQKIFVGTFKKNFTRLQDSIDAIEEILKINGLLPRQQAVSNEWSGSF